MKKLQSLNEDLFKENQMSDENAASIIGGGFQHPLTQSTGPTTDPSTHTGQPASDQDNSKDTIYDT